MWMKYLPCRYGFVSSREKMTPNTLASIGNRFEYEPCLKESASNTRVLAVNGFTFCLVGYPFRCRLIASPDGDVPRPHYPFGRD